MAIERQTSHLLNEVFPGIDSTIERCDKLGFPWNSKLFLKEKEGKVLSHVGLMEYPLLINGEVQKAGALHAICTKKAFQSQGYASKLIEEAIDYAKNKYELLILFTEIPGFYEKFSFKPVQEHRFHLPYKKQGTSSPLMPLCSPKDDALFIKLYQNKAALSDHLSVNEKGEITSFNTFFSTYPKYWSLHYCSTLNAIFSYEVKEKTLHLYDIITGSLPSLEQILDHIPGDINDIYFYFSPDRLTAKATPHPYLFDKCHFLVHGKWPLKSPFMIPPLSRC